MGSDDMVKRDDVLRWLRHTGMVHAIASFAANFPRSTPATPGDAAPTDADRRALGLDNWRFARAPSLEVAPPLCEPWCGEKMFDGATVKCLKCAAIPLEVAPPPGYDECPSKCGRWKPAAQLHCWACFLASDPEAAQFYSPPEKQKFPDWTPPAASPPVEPGTPPGEGSR